MSLGCGRVAVIEGACNVPPEHLGSIFKAPSLSCDATRSDESESHTCLTTTDLEVIGSFSCNKCTKCQVAGTKQQLHDDIEPAINAHIHYVAKGRIPACMFYIIADSYLTKLHSSCLFQYGRPSKQPIQ